MILVIDVAGHGRSTSHYHYFYKFIICLRDFPVMSKALKFSKVRKYSTEHIKMCSSALLYCFIDLATGN